MVRRSLIMAMLVAGSVLVACADDGPDAESARPVVSPTVTTVMTDSDMATPVTTVTTVPTVTPAAPNGLSVRVQSLDNFFRAEVIEVTAGTEVVWTNDGRIDHDVIPSDGGDWGVAAELFVPGDEYRHVFTLPGEYPYYCSIHGTAEFGMLGLVTVTEPA